MPPPSDPKPSPTGPANQASRVKPRVKPCPICGRPAAESLVPFCSERCRDVDLNRWLSGSYVIPARGDEPDDAD